MRPTEIDVLVEALESRAIDFEAYVALGEPHPVIADPARFARILRGHVKALRAMGHEPSPSDGPTLP